MDGNNITETMSLRGFFTTQKHLQGKTLREIERLLGFNDGRLSKGAKFFTPLILPGIDGFEFAGYSQVAGHHTQAQYGNINSPEGPAEKKQYDEMKKKVAGSWTLYGSERLIKVLPVTRPRDGVPDDFQYPPGLGIPQWKMTNQVECRVISFVRDYDGRFIPDQGYKEIRIK